MSVKIMSWVWEHSRSTGTDRLVLLALADRADEHGVCWPSISTLSDKAKVSISTARRAIRSLETLGELVSEDRPGTSNSYRITANTPVNVTDPTSVDLTEGVGHSDLGQSDTPTKGDRGTPVKGDRGGRSTVTDDTSVIHQLNRQRESARATQLPSDWMPTPEDIAKMRSECPDVDLQSEHRKFVDHWLANGKPMKNWSATWRNWIRRSGEFARPGKRSSGVDWDAAMRRANERDAS